MALEVVILTEVKEEDEREKPGSKNTSGAYKALNSLNTSENEENTVIPNQMSDAEMMFMDN